MSRTPTTETLVVPPFGVLPHDRPAPLSFAQERLWLAHELDRRRTAYNELLAIELHGALDVQRLRVALDLIVQRHDALRTTIALEHDLPVQRVAPWRPVALPYVSLEHAPGDRTASAALARWRAQPFDVYAGPLVRLLLIRFAERAHLLVVSVHHLICDAASASLLQQELGAIYAALVTDRPMPLAALSSQYADYARWERSWLTEDALAGALDRRARAVADSVAAVPLPDYPATSTRSTAAGTIEFALPAALALRVRQFARETRATTAILLMAMLHAVLHRYTAAPRIAIGTTVANRYRRELEPLIGFFANLLIIPSVIDRELSVREHVARVRADAFDAYGEQHLPYERLLRRLASEGGRTNEPPFRVAMTFLPADDETWSASGIVARRSTALLRWQALFDLEIYVQESAAGVHCRLVFAADLFARESMERFARSWITVMQAAVDAPDRRVAELPLLDTAGEHDLRVAWNDTRRPEPAGSVVAWMHEHAAARPDAIAVGSRSGQISYAALERRARTMTRLLRAHGVDREARVTVLLPRGLDLVAALVAILDAGGVYVPLDPAYPPDRLAYMQTAADATVHISTRALAERLPVLTPTLWIEDIPIGTAPRVAACPDTSAAPPIPRDHADAHDLDVDLDRDLAREHQHRQIAPRRLAYLMFTSGSTGRPKGALVEHRGLMNHLRAKVEDLAIGPDDRVAQNASSGFDISIWQMLTPLVAGGRIEIQDDDGARNAEGTLAWLNAHHVTVFETVPAFLASILDDGTRPSRSSLRWMISNAEALPGALCTRWLESYPGVRFLNAYGPTECSDDVSHYEVVGPLRQGLTYAPLAGPVRNMTFYVRQADGGIAPIGVPGELQLGGAGVGRGYWRRPRLTAERFVPDPFGTAAGARLYRTGDRVRWLPDRTLEFLGRFDFQIKLRGHRIELGEIESALLVADGVEQAVAIVRDDRLVAYVVGEAQPAALIATLRGILPAYMVPGAIVTLDRLPLTANGKIDRRALPMPEIGDAGPDLAGRDARTPQEELIAAIVADVLRVPAVGVDSDFFALGGHSLLATQVMTRLRAAFGVGLPLRALFDAPTVAGLARAVAAAGPGAIDTRPALTPAARDRRPPLSSAQQRLWFIHQLDPSSAAYHIPATVRLRGALQVPRLRESLTALATRHEALRTSFPAENGTPWQEIAPPAAVAVPIIDLSALSRPDVAARRIARVDASRPFPLANGPLMRVRLLALAADDHLLALTLHHIVSDGWSIAIVVRELTASYAARATGRTAPAAPLTFQYADYAVWQREWLASGASEAQVDYWRAQLADITPLDLPLDAPRQADATPRGQTIEMTIGADVVGALHALNRRAGVTLFMTLLAAFQVVLGRWSAQRVFAIGTDIANRTLPETEGLIGFFVNQLALRADLRGASTFLQLLARVRETTLAAYAHQDLPFDRVVDRLQPERHLGRSPLFQTKLVLQNVPRETPALHDVRVEDVRPVELPLAKFDVSLIATEERTGEITCALEYRADLFEAQTIRRLLVHVERVLSAAAREPGVAIEAIDLMTPAEQAEIVEGWNATAAPIPDTTVVARVAAQAALRPDAIAVAADEGQISYGVLDTLANRLANVLRAHGVGPEVCVGLCLPRGLALLPSILAIWKTGGVYVPLDVDAPLARITTQIDDLGHPLLLATNAQQMRWGSAGPARVLCLDAPEIAEAIAASPSTTPVAHAGDGQLAYIIYTSGSTGQPKGAMNQSRALVNRIAWMQAAFALTPGDRVLHKTPIGFDVSVWELVWPGWVGACLVMARPDGHRDPAYLAAVIRREQVTTTHFVPSLLEPFVREADSARCRSLRQIVCSGEALWPAVSEACATRLPRTALDNLYGPTEAAIDVTWWRWQPGAPRVPLGRPVFNTQVYVRDDAGRPTPIGVPGEIWLGGVQVGRGYWQRPRLTAERFMPDPFAHEAGARLYRTGDRGRWRPDGTLEYLGRLDFQVKLRGQRIELGEIEARLLALPGVWQAVAIVRDRRLLAYVTGTADPDGLRAALQSQVPDVLVPAAILVLPALPLTASGKIDRAALPDPPSSDASGGPPRTAVEATLARIWGEVLRQPAIGRDDHFFERGGDSILAIQVVARAQRAGLRLSVPLVFKHQRLAALAAAVATSAAPAPIVPAPTDPVPLSPVQQWLMAQPGAPHHFNQAVAFTVTPAMDLGRLRRLVADVLTHHAALHLRFVDTGAGWRQAPPPEAPNAQVPVIALDDAADPAAAFTRAASRLQASLDITHGPLFRVVTATLGAHGRRLVFVLHHLVVDAVSWRILLEDLQIAAALAQAGAPVILPPVPTPFTAWAEALATRADAVAADVGYWATAPAPLPLPRDRAGRNTRRSARVVTTTMPAEITRTLRETLAARTQASLHEALLTAVSEALAAWTRSDDVWIDVEGHGREPEAIGPFDLSRTVGWCTAIAPLHLRPRRGAAGALDRVRAIAAQAQALPRRGFGFGVLRAGSSDARLRAGLAALPSPEVIFNYLGEVDQLLHGVEGLQPAPESLGPEQDPRAPRPHAIEIAAAVADGRLTLAWTYSTQLHDAGTVQRLARRAQQVLEDIAAACADAPAAPIVRGRVDAAAMRTILAKVGAARTSPA